MSRTCKLKCSFVSFLSVCVGKCVHSVLAKRRVEYIPEGDTISLWCDVQHCGQNDWTGGWGITTDGQFIHLFTSRRIHLSNQSTSAVRTRLVLNIHNVNQSDSGFYQCNIKWKNITSSGHVTQINVTKRSDKLLGTYSIMIRHFYTLHTVCSQCTSAVLV